MILSKTTKKLGYIISKSTVDENKYDYPVTKILQHPKPHRSYVYYSKPCHKIVKICTKSRACKLPADIVTDKLLLYPEAILADGLNIVEIYPDKGYDS